MESLVLMKNLIKSQLMQLFHEMDDENQSNILLILIYYYKPILSARYLAAFTPHFAL